MNPAILLLPIVFTGSTVFPSAVAGDHVAPVAAPVALGAEAWYSSPQLCLIPQICLPISSPLASTYPADTLHIGAAGGNESARTYLSLRHQLAKSSTIASGVLRLPLDTSPVDGSLAPDLAKVKACTTQAHIKAVQASTAKPPAVDCTNAPISRVIGTPATELDIDLHPIARRLAKPGTSLALLPVLSLGATFDVTVSSNTRAKSSATTPVLILAVSTHDSSPSGATPTANPTHQGSAGDDGGTTAIPTPINTGPINTVPETSQPPLSASPPQLATPVPVAFGRPRAHGFDYPVVFLMPLLILAGLMAFGRQLTRPLRRDDAS